MKCVNRVADSGVRNGIKKSRIPKTLHEKYRIYEMYGTSDTGKDAGNSKELKIIRQPTGKSRNQGNTENKQHWAQHTHTHFGSTNVKVQNIQHAK
jgi:hypothetical protein